jgi:predicted TIM-barrel fold metal-dependent hydrolase
MRHTDRYVVVSADGHAGASMLTYRQYLESRWHDEFDAWAATYADAWDELDRDATKVLRRVLEATPTNSTLAVGVSADTLETNWDSDLRQERVEGEGIAGEVLFPNTVPPFFPRLSLGAPNPPPEEYERRLAGLRAHNRWLVDFCSELPGRRAGVGQILLNDPDEAVKDIRWVKEAGLTGGVLIPGVAPGDGLPELFDPIYEPVWQAAEDLEVVINRHGGGAGHPPYRSQAPMSRAIFMVETGMWARRALIHMLVSGVFERHPNLRLVLTEQGSGWVPGLLESLDSVIGRMRLPGSTEALFGYESIAQLSLKPSEYFERNCWLGATGLAPSECEARHEIGVDKLMWGSDFPHSEGTFPYTKEAFQFLFSNVPTEETRKMIGGTAAELYKFDPVALGEAAARIGPTVEATSRPLEQVPEAAACQRSFDRSNRVLAM